MENKDSDASLEEKIDTTNAGKKNFYYIPFDALCTFFLFHTLQVYAY
jgi:hypothetical protein